MPAIELNPEGVVALLGDYTPFLADLGKRLGELGHLTVRAGSISDAMELAESRKLRFSAALLHPEIPASRLAIELNQLRQCSRSAGLVYIAAGERPQKLACNRLREAGVEWALWNPVSDNELRFQLNRATSGWRHDHLRGQLRAPTNWSTLISASGREKLAQIYTLSGSGAFLATQRPSLSGAELTLELHLPSGSVEVTGHVVYTNVPGNRSLDRLPSGMAVKFGDTPLEAERAIRESVNARASDLAT
jgi:hypothetical protein